MEDIIYSKLLTDENVSHFVSVKDFSLDNGDEWRITVAESVGYSPFKAVAPEQTHGDRVVRVTPQMVGMGYLDKNTRIKNCDSLICNDPEICIHVVTADCVPILLYDRKTSAVAAVHAGWKGTALGIAEKTVREMQREYGSAPSDVIAYIGPSISKCCFEVDEDVAAQIGLEYVSYTSASSKPKVDLKEANRRQLVRIGVNDCNIEVSELCTVCDNLPSWRREKTSQRIGTGILSPSIRK